MFSTLSKKKDELMKKYRSGQKGLTLIEMLAVVFIIGVVLGLIVLSFSFFGRVDGTELTAKSKNVESAVLQVALGNDNRDIPAHEAVDGTGNLATRSEAGDAHDFITSDDFVNPNDAAVVFEHVANELGIIIEGDGAEKDFDGTDLANLVRPISAAEVQSSVSGDAKVVDDDDKHQYFVVVKKSQLYIDGALDYFNGYNDELAGQVFSANTIIDSDGVYYNGTHVVSAEDAKALLDGGAAANKTFVATTY